MIIRNDFMKNQDSNIKPVIPGIRTPFEYVEEQKKMRKAENQKLNGPKNGASADDLKQLEKQNNLNHFHNISQTNQPFGKK